MTTESVPGGQLTVYGLKISYFTGKLEGYLRYKEIPYRFHTTTGADFQRFLPERTGAMQMPAVELPDGRWMTDTSPMIDWFETQNPDHPILPQDPVQAFICRLIEDYADEWQWRPAMHFRWSYPLTAKLMAWQLADAMAAQVKAPEFLKRARIEKRQFTNFVKRDGVTPDTRAHVEQSYFRLLDILNPVFERRPYLLGNWPSLADIGLFGPLFRHYSMDPTPAMIMREQAPAVMEWVYRLWNAKASRLLKGGFVKGIPEDILPLLREIGETYLEAQCANAQSWLASGKTHSFTVHGVTYRDIPTSRYRVWCLEKLQERFAMLDLASNGALANLLDAHGCLEPLLRIQAPNSGYDTTSMAPFGRSLPVYERLV